MTRAQILQCIVGLHGCLGIRVCACMLCVCACMCVRSMSKYDIRLYRNIYTDTYIYDSKSGDDLLSHLDRWEGDIERGDIEVLTMYTSF